MRKFNKDTYLKKIVIKRWLNNYSRYLYLGLSCILVCTLGVYLAYSKFFVSKEEAVIKTTVGNFIQGDVVISAYIDNEYSSTIPGKDDGYVVEKIVCDNDATAEWNNDKWGLFTTNLSKRTKCNVYFKKVISKVPDIIATVDTSGKCPTVNEDGSVNVTAVEATNGYLCKAKDAYGDSYYYRGNVTNNYVKFADKYWRIVRINGDGTVRVIYDGTSAHANGENSSDRQIGTSAFNSRHNDNAYVGYMYGATGASTYAAAHANINDSTIKAYIDNWYKTNILGTANEQYLADNLFCNDRSLSFKNTGTGAGMSETNYRWYYYADSSYNNKMILTCPQQNDAFTVSDTTNGNGALTYPAGLLSTDEIVLAGEWSTSNSGYYLYSGQIWWASSPYYLGGDYAAVNVMSSDGRYSSYIVNSAVGVRPVLNLKSEALKYGDGTASNPYRLTE